MDDEVAHWMAVKAMEVYGVFLKHFSELCLEVFSLEDILKALELGFIPIVMPYGILKKYDLLPHTWDVTSDSISLLIASLLRADVTVLGKIVEGLTDREGRLLKMMRAYEVKDQSVFDKHVLELLVKYRIPLAVFNILKPWILEGIARLEEGEYTLILP